MGLEAENSLKGHIWPDGHPQPFWSCSLGDRSTCTLCQTSKRLRILTWCCFVHPVSLTVLTKHSLKKSIYENQWGFLKQDPWFSCFILISSTCWTNLILRKLVPLFLSWLAWLKHCQIHSFSHSLPTDWPQSFVRNLLNETQQTQKQEQIMHTHQNACMHACTHTHTHAYMCVHAPHTPI